MRKNNDGEELTSGRLPGTGGDFIDEQDVEGHRLIEGESIRQKDEGESIRQRDDDVEGHRLIEGEDTLFRTLSTQGEVLRKGPGDAPHGDR